MTGTLGRGDCFSSTRCLSVHNTHKKQTARYQKFDQTGGIIQLGPFSHVALVSRWQQAWPR